MATASLIVIGTSMGGLKALQVVLGGLPAGFPFPIAVVQHRGAAVDVLLRDLLQEGILLPVSEPQDKEAILAGRVYVAPADYHLLVDGDAFALSTEAPVRHARPSIDVLFESAAAARGSGVVGVILTGANDDGMYGATRIKARGGRIVVEDPLTAECAVMPRAAAPLADAVLPLGRISSCLADWCGAGADRP